MPKPTKPTGTIHQAIATPGAFRVERVAFPKSKEEIERFIAERYLASAKLAGIPVSLGNQNDTNDFDFNATIDGKPGFVELTEIAPLSRSGYNSASPFYDVIPFAEAIAHQINGKATKYAGVKNTPIVLLTYVTDWHFLIVPQVVEHLQFLMHDGEHGFARIDLLEPRVGGSDTLTVIYPPTSHDWSGYDPRKHTAIRTVFADVTAPLPRDQWPDAK